MAIEHKPSSWNRLRAAALSRLQTEEFGLGSSELLPCVAFANFRRITAFGNLT